MIWLLRADTAERHTTDAPSVERLFTDTTHFTQTNTVGVSALIVGKKMIEEDEEEEDEQGIRD